MAIEIVQFEPTRNHPWTPLVTDIIGEMHPFLSEADRHDPKVMADYVAPHDYSYYALAREREEMLAFGAVGRVKYKNELHLKLQYIGVVPKYRGQGLGTMLLSNFVQLAKRTGASALRAYPEQGAVAFYKARGYMPRPDVDPHDLFMTV
jgi:GNAT superfamily N-acetyltransferase